jgi:hypothetical protein
VSRWWAGWTFAAQVLVHVAPALEGALQDRLGDRVEQVADEADRNFP